MKHFFTIKTISLAASMVALVALVAMATSATGAYFSDSKGGAVNGTIGTVNVATSGGSGDNGLVFNWSNMLPGEVYSATANFLNTGAAKQDIWLVFNNKTALSAINSLGTWGAARITSTGGASFYSNNLNDHPVDQGTVCKMIPQMIKVAENVDPGAGGSVTFSFQYASKLGGNGPGMFNTFPVVKASNTKPGGFPTNDGALPGYDQYYVNAADGSGTGLPFQIVATQPGIAPGTTGTDAGF